eukprot:CAMPEP_0202822118 /NCGR_PEP_ID=MMETSP1389-20130828/10846_1 /ASSEMBLY_ACC=CAM_ASM_000865 /TAXON_ID=302021 /ORGANISM="Rhodomonas sp., Strain CCMP768" /LENGTH=122 /DNA_ID=CAMNT_0049494981 /DNA_START=1 /DNA_END=366 /DNA_ORIENTATION=+
MYLLEFTQAMDNPATMAKALRAKARQYRTAEDALERGQQLLPWSQRKLTTVITVPFIFGVRGAVMVEECLPLFQAMRLPKKIERRILAAGVRAAIAGACDMCHARLVVGVWVGGRGGTLKLR